MKDGLCPRCAATAIYRRGGNKIQLSDSPLPRFAWVDVYSCIACGYTETYIPQQEDRSFIADHWTPIAERPVISPDERGRVTGGVEDHQTQRLPPPDSGQ
jgi:predicted nucleic-acid-binding Zn-ribbon protein